MSAESYYTRIYARAPAPLRAWMEQRRDALLDAMQQELRSEGGSVQEAEAAAAKFKFQGAPGGMVTSPREWKDYRHRRQYAAELFASKVAKPFGLPEDAYTEVYSHKSPDGAYQTLRIDWQKVPTTHPLRQRWDAQQAERHAAEEQLRAERAVRHEQEQVAAEARRAEAKITGAWMSDRRYNLRAQQQKALRKALTTAGLPLSDAWDVFEYARRRRNARGGSWEQAIAWGTDFVTELRREQELRSMPDASIAREGPPEARDRAGNEVVQDYRREYGRRRAAYEDVLGALPADRLVDARKGVLYQRPQAVEWALAGTDLDPTSPIVLDALRLAVEARGGTETLEAEARRAWRDSQPETDRERIQRQYRELVLAVQNAVEGASTAKRWPLLALYDQLDVRAIDNNYRTTAELQAMLDEAQAAFEAAQ